MEKSELYFKLDQMEVKVLVWYVNRKRTTIGLYVNNTLGHSIPFKFISRSLVQQIFSFQFFVLVWYVNRKRV